MIANEHGEVGLAHQHQQFLAFVSEFSTTQHFLQVEYAFKFYVTVEGGMDFRAMLMKRKVNSFSTVEGPVMVHSIRQ